MLIHQWEEPDSRIISCGVGVPQSSTGLLADRTSSWHVRLPVAWCFKASSNPLVSLARSWGGCLRNPCSLRVGISLLVDRARDQWVQGACAYSPVGGARSQGLWLLGPRCLEAGVGPLLGGAGSCSCLTERPKVLHSWCLPGGGQSWGW